MIDNNLEDLFEILLENINFEIDENLKQDAQKLIQQNVIPFLNSNNYFYYLYQKLIIDNDFKVLIKKTKKQITQLENIYYSKIKLFERKKTKKLKIFENEISKLKPIKSDDISQIKNEFLCPNITKKIRSFGYQDIIILSPKYVYGSFNKIFTHNMSQNNPIILNEKDILNKTQIVFIDISNIIPLANNRKRNFLELYLTNIFDYNYGKKLLAIYLAIIYEDWNEVKLINIFNKSKKYAQSWFQQNIPFDSKLFDPYKLKFVDITNRKNEIFQIMEYINKETGIEPPLNFELKILNSAKFNNN